MCRFLTHRQRGTLNKGEGMNLAMKVVVLFAVAAIGSPAAFASKPPSNPGKSDDQTTTTTTMTTTSSQAKAYGRYCQNQSKQHVAGQKGTPFSQCVTAMAKAGHGTTPKSACAALSKKHVAGEKGTPFSRCVVAAAHLLKDQHKQNP